eukprot:TRINITY_DN1193_c0_g1_i2.p1 TRINITY_DN1193_c0_g1~~TRINITY_DN1193_c0_g1_i2.p1  ORF type:complete len:1175 (-),score=340.58 TRINITY_DN1193_c0_g1_i2:85-3609(-)
MPIDDDEDEEEEDTFGELPQIRPNARPSSAGGAGVEGLGGVQAAPLPRSHPLAALRNAQAAEQVAGKAADKGEDAFSKLQKLRPSVPSSAGGVDGLLGLTPASSSAADPSVDASEPHDAPAASGADADEDEEEDGDTFGELPQLQPSRPSSAGGVEGLSGVMAVPRSAPDPLTDARNPLDAPAASGADAGEDEEEDGDTFGDLPQLQPSRPSSAGGVEGLSDVVPAPTATPNPPTDDSEPLDAPAASGADVDEDGEEDGDTLAELPQLHPEGQSSAGRLQGLSSTPQVLSVAPDPPPTPDITGAAGSDESEDEEGEDELSVVEAVRRKAEAEVALQKAVAGDDALELEAAIDKAETAKVQEQLISKSRQVLARLSTQSLEKALSRASFVQGKFAGRVTRVLKGSDIGNFIDEIAEGAQEGIEEDEELANAFEDLEEEEIAAIRERARESLFVAEDSNMDAESERIRKCLDAKKREEKFVLKSEFAFALCRISRLERYLERVLGNKGIVLKSMMEAQANARGNAHGIEELQKDIHQLGKDSALQTHRIRDDKHRIENAAEQTVRTAKDVAKVSGNLTVTKEALRGDVQRMAKALQVLAEEVKTIDQEQRNLITKAEQGALTAFSQKGQAQQGESHGKPVSEGGHAPAAASYDHHNDEVLRKLSLQMKEHALMVRDVNTLRQEMEYCVKEATFKQLDVRLEEQQSDLQKLETFVKEKFFDMANKEKTDAMAKFASSWDPYKKARLLGMAMDNWTQFVKTQARHRQAITSTRNTYAKMHVTARLRSWWYIMQRDKTAQHMAAFSDILSREEAKLEGVRNALFKHEKASAEQGRGIIHRLVEAEKLLDQVDTEKANRQELHEKFSYLSDLVSKEMNLKPLQDGIEQAQRGIQKLEECKTDKGDSEALQQKMLEIERETRAWLQKHDEVLGHKADIPDMNLKADARTAEKVLVLLAKQADQLANLVSRDIDQLRQALTRFLEISPDHRKAALTVGLEPTSECVSCRALKKLPPAVLGGPAPQDTDMLVTGADGSLYRASPEQMTFAQEQTRRVLTDKLRFPLSLASSMVAGNTVERSPSPEAEALPQLRRMLGNEEGWLAQKESQDVNTPRKATPRSASGRSTLQEATSNASGLPCSKDLCTPPIRRPPSAQERDRPPSSRSYFPALASPRGGSARKSS